ncbi:MAG: type II secretion system secretin GspD [Myxococcales bacterium]|nr:type II secretion system secretin GspD [Myxococcales bacterium]
MTSSALLRLTRPLRPGSLLGALGLAVLASLPALAQRRPPAAPPPPAPQGAPRERQIQPALPTADQPAGEAKQGKRSCEEVRRTARFGIYFDKVEIEKLVQTVADATCKTFILPENVRGRISIIGPEKGKVEVNSEQFYAAFLAALDANALSIYPHGRFLKIVDKARAKQFPIPTITDPSEEYTTNEQMLTRMFKVKYVEIEQLRGVLQQLVTPSGDTIPFQPDTIIVNDLGSNMHRLEKIVEQLDSRAASDEIKVLQIQYASAQEIADKVQKLFESRVQRPGQRPGLAPPPPPVGASVAAPVGQPGQVGQAPGPATLSQLIPDERTNKLIVIASPAAMERIMDLIREIDIPTAGSERINVYYLENASAEELASTLQNLAQGTANRPRPPTPMAPPPPMPGQPAGARGPAQAVELFQGEVKISADKATNALVIIASQSDYRNLVRVIEKLDIPRRQVFVEAVIMEVNLDRSTEFGVNLHSGYSLRSADGNLPGLVATKYTKQGTPPSLSLLSLAGFGGFLAGLQGPMIPELAKLGIDVPAFGVILHALQQSSDVNVLSTPHILTTDNEEAEITVGQNVPFQAGFSPTSLGGLAGGTTLPGVTPGLAAGLGGLGSLFAPITRQNVELKLTVKPQINESDFVRMVITEQTEEIASSDPVLGPTTSKRSAKTTVVARDQETVVLGGIMQDRRIESVAKVPILGDLPIVGHLFREENIKKVKTNLLLFLTPYIIKGQGDFRRIFERKMRERQQFVEQFYGQVPGYEVAIDFSRKQGPLAKMSHAIRRELQRIEHGGPGVPGEKVIRPGGPSEPAPAPAQPAPEAVPPAEGGPPIVEPPRGEQPEEIR